MKNGIQMSFVQTNNFISLCNWMNVLMKIYFYDCGSRHNNYVIKNNI